MLYLSDLLKREEAVGVGVDGAEVLLRVIIAASGGGGAAVDIGGLLGVLMEGRRQPLPRARARWGGFDGIGAIRGMPGGRVASPSGGARGGGNWGSTVRNGHVVLSRAPRAKCRLLGLQLATEACTGDARRAARARMRRE